MGFNSTGPESNSMLVASTTSARGDASMGDKLDSGRFGELWNPLRLQVIEQELLAIQPYVVLSGGWAWHFLTPPGHVEYKHAHDHKDAGVFVAPPLVAPLMALLSALGYQ